MFDPYDGDDSNCMGPWGFQFRRARARARAYRPPRGDAGRARRRIRASGARARSGKGKLTAYVLDGEAESPVRIEQPEIEIRITVPDTAGNASASELPLRLSAVYNILTGEKEGDTSEFAVRSERLKSLKQFRAVITAITVKGNEFEDVGFRFPEGNE